MSSKSIYHIHHIIPKHMGGTNDESNLVKLSISEHANAHYELWQEYKKEEDLIAWRMLSGQISSAEARILAVKNANTGRKQTDEHIKKRVTARLKTQPNGPTFGKKLPDASEERKQKISEALKGKSNWHKGKTRSELTKEKLSIMSRNRQLLSCPKCGKQMPKANLVRFHGLYGENCKS